MTPTVRRILLSQSLEKKIQNIVKNNSIAMYVPTPGVTCFQDSACTTAANVDDPVGGLKDYLGLYPATQATSGLRPILRGKVKNHLTYSEQVNSWALTNILAFGSGSITNAINDVDGNLTADFVCPNTSNVAHYVAPTVDSIIGPSVCRIYCKAGGYSKLGVREQTTGSFEAAFNLSGAGTVIKITGTGASATIDAEVNGWYKITILFNPTTAEATLFRFYVLNDAYVNETLNTYTYAADGTSGLYLSKGQISPGSSIETYINTNSVSLSSSYGPYWLDFDGVDDNLGGIPYSLLNNDFCIITAATYRKTSGLMLGPNIPYARVIWILWNSDISFAEANIFIIPQHGPPENLGVKQIFSFSYDNPVFSAYSGINLLGSVDYTFTHPGNTNNTIDTQAFPSGMGLYAMLISSAAISYNEIKILSKYVSKITGISI